MVLVVQHAHYSALIDKSKEAHANKIKPALSRRFDSIGPTDLVTDMHRQIQTRPVYFSWYLPGAAAPGEYDRALVYMSFQSCSRTGLVDYTVGQKNKTPNSCP